jgi:hypothetical protein
LPLGAQSVQKTPRAADPFTERRHRAEQAELSSYSAFPRYATRRLTTREVRVRRSHPSSGRPSKNSDVLNFMLIGGTTAARRQDSEQFATNLPWARPPVRDLWPFEPNSIAVPFHRPLLPIAHDTSSPSLCVPRAGPSCATIAGATTSRPSFVRVGSRFR